MKRLLLPALLILCVSAASAQSLNSAALPRVGEARLIIQDGSMELSYAQLDTLQHRLETTYGSGVGDEGKHSPLPVLSLRIEAYHLKHGWYHVTVNAELLETVRRVQEPALTIPAITWKTKYSAMFNPNSFSLLEGTWDVLATLIENLHTLRRHASP